MSQQQVTLPAKDGPCKAWVLTPDGQGPWPAVIFYCDVFGIRPAMIQMAAHVASQGYLVLLPDLFYRFGDYGPFEPKEVMKGDFRSVVGPIAATTNNKKAGEDTADFIAYLDTRPDVASKKIAVVGFCMSGGMALTAAAYYPDRIVAAASFHGGRLASDQPDSPHLLADKIKAEVYIAGADADQSYPPEMAQRLEEALTKAGVKHKCEIYAGKHHGWMKPDMPVYDAEAAKRGWRELFTLLGRTLR